MYLMLGREGDPKYIRLLSGVGTPYANHYNFLITMTFDVHREDAEELIEKLRKYLEKE